MDRCSCAWCDPAYFLAYLCNAGFGSYEIETFVVNPGILKTECSLKCRIGLLDLANWYKFTTLRQSHVLIAYQEDCGEISYEPEIQFWLERILCCSL